MRNGCSGTLSQAPSVVIAPHGIVRKLFTGENNFSGELNIYSKIYLLCTI